MDRNHSFAFAPSFRLAVRHVVFRFVTLILKTISAIFMALLNSLFGISLWFSRLARAVLSIVPLSRFVAPERHGSVFNRISGSAEQGRTTGASGIGGLNGVPEGWVRYVICRTEDISEFDLENCEGCRQVLETEIEMALGQGESLGELAEKLERVDDWLEKIEKLNRDSGYSSPEPDGEVKGEILWGLPNY